MSIDGGATRPLAAAVHGAVNTSPRQGSGVKAPVHPRGEGTAPAPTTETEYTGPKRVELPEFPNYELSFRLDKEHGRVVIQVIDSKTGTVVRTIPPEDVSRALRRLPDGRGVLLNRAG